MCQAEFGVNLFENPPGNATLKQGRARSPHAVVLQAASRVS